VDGNEQGRARPEQNAGALDPSTTTEEPEPEGDAAAADGQVTPARPSGPAPPEAAPEPPRPASANGSPPPDTATAAATPETAAPGAAGPGDAARQPVPAYGAGREGRPKIFDLPDQQQGRPTPDKPLVLGGAAAAEGRTTGPQPRIAGPAPGTPPDARDGESDESGRGRHFLTSTASALPRWPVLAAAVPVVVLVLLIAAWAVDTAALSGQVMRNVKIAGHDVGGLGEASLPEVMDEINGEVANRPVTVTSSVRSLETTAGEIGLSVDTDATTKAALQEGRDHALLTRPFTWFASFFGDREVDVRYSVKESQVTTKLRDLQGPETLAPVDPTLELQEGAWAVAPGKPGQDVDAEDVAAQLPAAAAQGAPDDPIEIDTDLVDIAPRFSNEEAQAVADTVNERTADGLTLTAGDAAADVDAATLRSWYEPSTEDGDLELRMVPESVNAALPEIFSDVSAEPKDASITLEGGTPVVVPAEQGLVCCGDDSRERIAQALRDGEDTVELEVETVEPELTTEEAENLGVKQPVGGNHAWQNGGPTTAGPGFTTYHDCCESRVTNIHRMADIVRGTLVLPGETFSINETVGERTAAKGFVEAGAIRNGEHVPEIGGGVSQFATTTFNAAYFAGLDIPVYQAHTEYFSRYPRGREATMGFPAPDLQFTNNTPHGILVWTSYTDTSLTVTLYSTPHAKGEQTGISESKNDQCDVVTTTRTRTWPDGRTENDTFRAQYRPGANIGCDGKRINPEPDADGD
jgi:vancomycin resistance protein YoaR